MRAFSHTLAVDHGFKTGRLITVSVSLDGTSHVSASQQLEYLAETLTRVGRLPEVTRASATQFLPLEATMFMGGPYTVDGQKSKPGVGTDIIPVMSDYFAATSGTILYGRDFTDAEVQSDTNVTILNDTFAKLLFVPEHSPKGFPSTVVIHVDRAPKQRLAMIRDVFQSVDRKVPIFGVKTKQQRMTRPSFGQA